MLKAKLQNFIKSELCCKHCGQLIFNDETLISLQGFRYSLNRKYGRNIRLIITSGYRCPIHNKNVGGAANSQHTMGTAFDLISPDINYKQIYDEAVKSGLFSTVIRYDKSLFVHVDTRQRTNYAVENWAWDK